MCRSSVRSTVKCWAIWRAGAFAVLRKKPVHRGLTYMQQPGKHPRIQFLPKMLIDMSGRLIRQALSEMAWLCAADLPVTALACRNQALFAS